MDRFEDNSIINTVQRKCTLHSSMDRFEVALSINKERICKLYIPVWIDLKEVVAPLSKLQGMLYIPVWIDLKFSAVPVSFAAIILYIPVWIDLKESLCCIVAILNYFTFQYG